MIVKQYIKDFEQLGFGMFVHFGLYSVLGCGEWAKYINKISDTEYEKLAKQFNPDRNWAVNLVHYAKDSGCRYISLTTRHHDGFSLYDTDGLSTYDAPHYCGRDLVREFVEACNNFDIIPFFYHTLLDWHEKSYFENFNEYLEYLQKSITVLCKNYGKIGGIWFDGMWNKPDEDWHEDELYTIIRSFQPDAMIINNTGLSARGVLGNIELDSVTFERGKPRAINLETSPKYVASEMCQTMCDHWGYAKNDLNYKSAASLIEDLCACRRIKSNFLLNIGPKDDGSLRPIEGALLDLIGRWINIYDEAIHTPSPSGIDVLNKPKDFILKDGDVYYLFVHNLPMVSDSNVAINQTDDYDEVFEFDKIIVKAYWIDNGKNITFTQNKKTVVLRGEPFAYGGNYVVRVAKFETDKNIE